MLDVFIPCLFLNFGIGLLVLVQVGGQRDHTLLAEVPREGILFRKQSAFRRPKPHLASPRRRLTRCNTYASACTKTSGVTHLD